MHHIKAQKYLRVFLLVSALALALGSGTASGQAPGKVKVGIVQQVMGKASVTHSGENKVEPVEAGMTVYQLDTFKTEKGGRVRIGFLDQSIVSVAEGSSLTINSYVFDPKKKQRVGRVKVLWGRVKCIVNDLTGYGGKKFEVETETAVIGVRGTEFLVLSEVASAGKAGATKVAAVANSVSVSGLGQAAGDAVVLNPGYFTSVASGASPTAPAVLTPAVLGTMTQGLFPSDAVLPAIKEMVGAAGTAAGVAAGAAAGATGTAVKTGAIVVGAGAVAVGAAAALIDAATGSDGDEKTADAAPDEKPADVDTDDTPGDGGADTTGDGGGDSGQAGDQPAGAETDQQPGAAADQPADQPPTEQPVAQAGEQQPIPPETPAAGTKPDQKVEPKVDLRDFPKYYDDEFALQQSARKTNKKFSRYLKAGEMPWRERFVDHGNGTVSDLAAGLMWQKKFTKAIQPNLALKYVEQVNKEQPGGFSDWRQPTTEELMFLYLSIEKNKAVPIDVPKAGIGLWTGDATPTDDRVKKGYGYVMFYKGMFSTSIECKTPRSAGRFSAHHLKGVRKIK